MNLKELQDQLGDERSRLENIAANVLSLTNGDGKPSNSIIPLHQHYKLFRDYVEHEDGLINKRLLWTINIQGFLFLGYGYAVQKLADPPLKEPASLGNLLYVLLFVFPGLGVVVGFFCWMVIWAAVGALKNLETEWTTRALAQHQNDAASILPGLVGGGKRRYHVWGLLAPTIFPWMFIIAWVILLGFSVHFFYLRHGAG